jgi:hypothetical protein
VYIDANNLASGTLTNRYGLYQAGTSDLNVFKGQVNHDGAANFAGVVTVQGSIPIRGSKAIISNNYVTGNISSNLNGSQTWFLLAENENASPGYMMQGSVMAGSYTAWSMFNIWIRKVYTTDTVVASITGLTRDGSFTVEVQRVTYGGTKYIALYFSGSNPEIDVLWTGYRLDSLVTNNEFLKVTSGVTVVSTVASY